MMIMSKRLIDLAPEWRMVRANWTPKTGGEPTEDYTLSFNCPICKRGVICIQVGPTSDMTVPRWQYNQAPTGTTWPQTLTLSPSIAMPVKAHGQSRPDCGWHGHIINGQVLSS